MWHTRIGVTLTAEAMKAKWLLLAMDPAMPNEAEGTRQPEIIPQLLFV